MRKRVGVFVAGAALAASGLVWAAEVPLAVSPGSPTGATTESRCPTFSWGMVPGAASYDLVVYQVTEKGQDTKPILQQRFSGSVHAWTPSLGSCLERGGQYAWSVRAVGGRKAAEWSAPSLFEVAAGPLFVYIQRGPPAALPAPDCSLVEVTCRTIQGRMLLRQNRRSAKDRRQRAMLAETERRSGLDRRVGERRAD